MEKDASVMVKTEDLSKTYRLPGKSRVEALKNLAITIQKGECIFIEGPSGSGKSTLLNLMGCLDRPSRGRMFLDGEDTNGFSEEELCRIRRERIGYAFQDFRLLPRMTAWENVSVCLVPLGVPEQERFQRASALLDQLGLHERIFHRPEEMSGGEQQRVSVARALINGPELLLADEPTSNIDAASAEKVFRILAGLKEEGCTLVIATHDIEIFKQIRFGEKSLTVDRIYRLAGGEVQP